MVIHFELKSNGSDDPVRWRDAAIVTREDGRYLIDDIVYDLDHEPALLSESSATVYRGGKWIGKFGGWAVRRDFFRKSGEGHHRL